MIDVFSHWLATWSPLFIAIIFFWILWYIIINAFWGY